MQLPRVSCAPNGGAVSASLHPLNPQRQPSLDALISLVAHDMNGVNSAADSIHAAVISQRTLAQTVAMQLEDCVDTANELSGSRGG